MLSQLRESIADRYRIERELGHGGMATVYLADDLKHGRKVAIKVMLPEVAAAIGLDRFLREIEIAARLTHPHILPLHDSGAADGQLYYVMPYIEGESLRARIEREQQLPLDDALRLTREIASALGHAHYRGLVHRDIKPENVLLADDIALVADFGIARTVSSQTPDASEGLRPTVVVSTSGEPDASVAETLAMTPSVTPRSTPLVTQAGAVFGTPRYMAPEQAAGSAEIDGRADQYALGCVLYEMLAGRAPFAASSAREMLERHLEDEVPPLSAHRAGLPPGVERVIEKALSKSPADRYATMARFAEALAVAASGGPTPMPSPSPERVAVTNNLPRQRTHFIGRENELAECARLMGGTRLLTLTGIGGGGKTRLALSLAESLLATFPDGVWFVDLAPIQDAERVLLTVATTLGVGEEPGTPLIDRLTARLATQGALLVLDNCEHVLVTAAELAEALLAASAELKLVVTSREALRIAGEQVVVVRSLTLPAASATDLHAIEGSEAVRLFVDRARLTGATFRLDAANAPAVVEICRRLDGIPLAIELAAARVKMLAVEEIRAKLDDRFRLLSGGSKTALPRHQTLRATIQWSYDQLSPEERALLRRLSVFAGGWTLEGAARVVGEGEDEFEVLDRLTRLGDKSLVTGERIEGGVTRYSMLETVRHYAQERLDESGEGDQARTRHLAFYLALATEAQRNLQGPRQGTWLSRLDHERENLLAAHRWCERAESGAALGLKLVTGLHVYWHTRGLLELGYGVTVEALTRAGAQERNLARALGLSAAGQFGLFMGRYAEAQGYLEECLSILRKADDKARVSGALLLLGNVSMGQGERAAARRCFEESLALARELGNKIRLSGALNGLAELEHAEWDLDAAEPLYAECLALNRELGDRGNIANGLVNLARVSIGRGAEEPARVMLLEALAIAEEVGNSREVQSALEVAAGLAAFSREWELAARFHGASETQRERMAMARDPVHQTVLAPLIARARVALGETAFAAADAAGRALPYEDAVAEARTWLAGGT